MKIYLYLYLVLFPFGFVISQNLKFEPNLELSGSYGLIILENQSSYSPGVLSNGMMLGIHCNFLNRVSSMAKINFGVNLNRFTYSKNDKILIDSAYSPNIHLIILPSNHNESFLGYLFGSQIIYQYQIIKEKLFFAGIGITNQLNFFQKRESQLNNEEIQVYSSNNLKNQIFVNSSIEYNYQLSKKRKIVIRGQYNLPIHTFKNGSIMRKGSQYNILIGIQI